MSPEADTVARTIWGEARNQEQNGMRARHPAQLSETTIFLKECKRLPIITKAAATGKFAQELL